MGNLAAQSQGSLPDWPTSGRKHKGKGRDKRKDGKNEVAEQVDAEKGTEGEDKENKSSQEGDEGEGDREDSKPEDPSKDAEPKEAKDNEPKEAKDTKDTKDSKESSRDNRTLKKLKQYILSDKASTDKEIKEEPFTPLTSEEITQLLVENVKGVESMRDRTGSTPVVTYIISTTTKGLPLFAGSKATNEHTKKALQYILYKARDLPEKIRKPLLTRLADGFTACQMEQGRVIDSIYGSLSGRDKSFKEQVLALVDIQKEQVLNMVVAHFNPNAWKTDDGNPKGQIPHIQSAYVYEIGTDLGLRGVKAAKLDKDRPTVLFSSNIKTTFLSLFQIEELISNFVNDVNQQDKEAERVISLKSLMDWAGDTENNNGFDPYCIFYDEDVRKYDGTPKEENAYQPYINRQVAISIMNHLFLKK